MDVGRLYSKLRPFRVEGGLVAIGGNGDGTYLFPKRMLTEVDGCISPGVGSYSNFEVDLAVKCSIRTLMLDGNVDKPQTRVINSIFIKKNLTATEKSSGKGVTLDWCVEEYFNHSKSLVLQMDIEGDEYSILLSSKEKLLNRFSVVILELHDINRWKKRDVFEKFYSQALNNLLEYFTPVHLHINPYCPTFRLMGMNLPSVIELTLVQKTNPILTSEYASLPNPLDFDFDQKTKTIDFERLNELVFTTG